MPAACFRLTSLAQWRWLRLQTRPIRSGSNFFPASRRRRPYAQLLVGTETGDDAAVWQIDDQQLRSSPTTDFFHAHGRRPARFRPDRRGQRLIGRLCNGREAHHGAGHSFGMPLGKLPVETVRAILQGGASICAEAGIPVAGGHSIDAPEPIYGLRGDRAVPPRRRPA